MPHEKETAMLSRRQFLCKTLKGSSLVALSSVVPGFVLGAANAAEVGKDNTLVILEMGGGNDGLNTVIPYGDDLYHKARPTLRYKKEEVVRIDDHIGLHPALRQWEGLRDQLAIIQGVGYPNPNRSHFESMDIWQSADPRRTLTNGWLGRSLGSIKIPEGEIVGMHIGTDQLPLAMQGSSTGTPTIDPAKPYELLLDGKTPININQFRGEFDGPPIASEPPRPPDIGPTTKPPPNDHRTARMKLIRDLASVSSGGGNDMLQFVQRSSLHTYTAVERLRELMRSEGDPRFQVRRFRGPGGELEGKLSLIARIIQAGFGTRVFYVSIDGFDTHSAQRNMHQELMQTIANSVSQFMNQLGGHADRVLLMTFSEFGRRVHENGSKGTDHGSGSCMFVLGRKAKGGLVGKHPSLSDLDAGDLRHSIDFRQVYATLLDNWLGCDSTRVLGGKYDHLPLIKQS
jgi:uncharacterized protein (DUF1501 family)